MIEFKKIPIISHYDKNENEADPRDHYNVNILTGCYGEVKEKEDYDPENNIALFDLETELEENDLQKLIRTESPDWNMIKTIFLEESCTIPMARLRKFCGDKGIGISRSKEKSDLVIYGKDFTDDLFNEETNERFVTKDNLIRKINRMKKDRSKFDHILPMLEGIGSNDVVMLKWCDDLIPQKELIEGDCWVITDDQRFADLRDKKGLYCHQDVLLGSMGSEIIDETMFGRLCQMFDSEDNANTTVAMEIMANCNYEKSILYLLELMRKYHPTNIYQTTSRDHVSFKSLRDWLDHYEPKNENDNYEKIVEIICKRNLMTEANYKRVLEFILKKDRADNSCVWEPVTIDLIEKWKKHVIWDKKVEIIGEPVVIERNEAGDPLMSVTPAIIDLSL